MDICTKKSFLSDDLGSAGGSHKTNRAKVIGITISAAVIILGLCILCKKRKSLSILKGKMGHRGNAQVVSLLSPYKCIMHMLLCYMIIKCVVSCH